MQHQKKWRGILKNFVKPYSLVKRGCGKTHLVLELIEKEYNKHFDYFVVIFPTLQENDNHHAKEWIKNDDSVCLVEP